MNEKKLKNLLAVSSTSLCIATVRAYHSHVVKTWHEEEEEDEDEDEEEDEFGNEEPKEWHDQFLRMVPILTTSTAEIKKDPKAKFFPGWFAI